MHRRPYATIAERRHDREAMMLLVAGPIDVDPFSGMVDWARVNSVVGTALPPPVKAPASAPASGEAPRSLRPVAALWVVAILAAWHVAGTVSSLVYAARNAPQFVEAR